MHVNDPDYQLEMMNNESALITEWKKFFPDDVANMMAKFKFVPIFESYEEFNTWLKNPTRL